MLDKEEKFVVEGRGLSSGGFCLSVRYSGRTRRKLSLNIDVQWRLKSSTYSMRDDISSRISLQGAHSLSHCVPRNVAPTLLLDETAFDFFSLLAQMY